MWRPLKMVKSRNQMTKLICQKQNLSWPMKKSAAPFRYREDVRKIQTTIVIRFGKFSLPRENARSRKVLTLKKYILTVVIAVKT